MKDEKGFYYYPFPQNRRARMYVKEEDGDLCFRMWNADDPNLWMEHGWIPYNAIKQAMTMYKGKGFDPAQAYDLNVAKAILKEKKH